MQEKTPVEKIDEMYEMVSSMQKQINIIEKNLNLLNSKANGQILSNIPDLKSFKPKNPLNEQVSKDLEKKATIGVPQITQPEPTKPTIKPKKVILEGKLLDQEGNPKPSIDIKIIKEKNKEIIAETRTNKAGQWLKYVPPGKYIIKIVNDIGPNEFRLVQATGEKERIIVK